MKYTKDINMYNSILRGLIRNSGLTQNEFSEKVNLSKCVISRLINCFKENNHGRHSKRKDRSDHTQNPTIR